MKFTFAVFLFFITALSQAMAQTSVPDCSEIGGQFIIYVADTKAADFSKEDLLNLLSAVSHGSVGLDRSDSIQSINDLWLYVSARSSSTNPTGSQGEKEKFMDQLSQILNDLPETSLFCDRPGVLGH